MPQRDKEQGLRDKEDRGWGVGKWRLSWSGRQKTASDAAETDVAHRKTVAYNGKSSNPVLREGI